MESAIWENTRSSAAFKWLSACRPKTLPLSAAGIVVGSFCAIAQKGSINLKVAAFGILTAASLQVTANLANDLGDFLNGADIKERRGPRRYVASGEIAPKQMKQAVIIAALASALFGTMLIISALSTIGIKGAILLFGAGALSIAAAITYTCGAFPYGYAGFGDIAVVAFFGIFAVCGTYFLHTGEFAVSSLLAALFVGFLSASVLNINNIRDIETDKKTGKVTLAVILGPKRARLYHLALIALALAAISIYLYAHTLFAELLVLAAFLPFFLKRALNVVKASEAAASCRLNEELGRLSLMVVIFSLSLFVIRFVICRCFNGVW
ncbi:MAG: 1,4-dihydroxy-2-naphthoate octaprenyltransferase [Candidatus Dadabacteria bacterium]|nr:MAG: 1,4-dihydroxy-2-naphthoate octaprenyltransferase [Candidatus Dadabacteria bacterium]